MTASSADDVRPTPALPRIFVGIPSYRDGEAPWTIDDLFSQAEHPDRVTVGVCWQLEGGDEVDCSSLPAARQAQVRQVRFDASPPMGSGRARAEALALARDEDYVLLIDSHMRFVPGWDSQLVAALESLPGDRTALTGWLPGYLPPRSLQPAPPGHVWRIGVRELTPRSHPSIVHLGPVAAPREGLAAFGLTPFIVGNFVFSRRSLYDVVPIDPHIFMYGEEIAFSARLWTHGFDLYQPRDPLLYHYWKPAAVHAGDAYKHGDGPLVARTNARVRHLLGLERSDDAEATRELDRYGHGKVRRLDDLWLASGVDPRAGVVAPAALQGRWNEGRTPSPAAPPRIFVSIPSYRDPETQWTLKDLFEKAAHPERVFVGVCWQFVAGEDAHCFAEPCPRPQQLRVLEVKADDSLGACWARQQAWSLWRGEEYALLIDAHMRFEPGWDELLLGMLAQCPSRKPVLTTYPTSYTGRDECDRNGIFKMAFRDFVVDAADTPPKLMYQTLRIGPQALPDGPIPTATVASGFIFARAELFQEVPIDPHIYFFGDDLSFATRAWTSGWDFFSPHRHVVFHLWDRSLRPGHWNDQPQNAARLRRRTEARVAHLVGMARTEDPQALHELDRYGLGSVRSLAEYERFSGVDFTHRTVSERARRGDVTLSEPAGAPRTASRETACGHRSPVLLRTSGAIVIDDFLPEDAYRSLFDYVSQVNYQYINTQGAVRRVWDLSNGFPLRSEKNLFFHAPHAIGREGSFHYPSQTPLDGFVDAVNAALPEVGTLVGEPGPEGWNHFSVTSWLYPPNTGLSLHDDGAGIYSGAYVYYLNPEWRPHWGGVLIVMDEEANRAVADRKKETPAQAFHAKKWLHLSGHDELVMAHGIGRSIFPKRNRMVFIAPDAYHLVTRVLPEAGDNVRMSLAGFFHRRGSARPPG